MSWKKTIVKDAGRVGNFIKRKSKRVAKAADNLPMDLVSQQNRAKKMGYDTSQILYHGTRGDIKEFSKDALGETTGAGSARKGFFFATEPETAGQYAEISSKRPALRDASGEEVDKFADVSGPKSIEFKRYNRERELKSLQSTNKYAEDYLKKLPETKAYWLQQIERAKGPPEHGIRADGTKFEKFRTPLPHAEAMLAKVQAKEQEYKQLLSPAGQKKLNKEIAAKQKELDEVVNYQLDSEGGQNIVPVHLKYKNPLVHDFKGERYREVSYNELMEQAKKKGHDAVIFKNTFDPGYQHHFDENEVPQDIVAVFEPHQIRSVNAKFDPKKKKSGNILDSIAPLAVGGAAGAAALSSEDAEAAGRTKLLNIAGKKIESTLVAGGPGFKIYHAPGVDGWVLNHGKNISVIPDKSAQAALVGRYVNLPYQPANQKDAIKIEFEGLLSSLKPADTKKSIAPLAIGSAAVGASQSWADDVANNIPDLIQSDPAWVGQKAMHGLQTVDKYAARPLRAGFNAALDGQNPFTAAYDSVANDQDVTEEEIGQKLTDRTGLTAHLPDGERFDSPFQAPIDLGVGATLDATNLIGAGVAPKAAKGASRVYDYIKAARPALTNWRKTIKQAF